MKTKDEILIYAERVDRNGLKHYGVNSYNPRTGFMTYFSDLVDDDCRKTIENERNIR